MIFLRFALALALVLTGGLSPSEAQSQGLNYRYCSYYNSTSQTRCEPGGTGGGWELGSVEAAAGNLLTWFKATMGACGNGTKPEVTLDPGPTEGYGRLTIQPCPGGIVTYQTFGTIKEEAPQSCAQNVTNRKNVLLGHVRMTARSDGALWETNDGRFFYKEVAPPTAIPTLICDGSCNMVATGAPGDWWISKNPDTNGNYTLRREQDYLTNGSACNETSQSPEVNPSPPAGPACDGFMGTLNGQPLCAKKELPTGFDGGKTPKLDGTTGTTGATVPTLTDGKTGPNGEKPGKPTDSPGGPDVSGTGRNMFGPPTPSTPTKGTVTTTTTRSDGTTSTSTAKIELPGNCGVPGQPACKMDESGTPTGKGVFDGADKSLSDADAARSGWLGSGGLIGGKADKDTSFAMPAWVSYSAQCQPWTLGELKLGMLQEVVPLVVNVCPHRELIAGAVSFVWVFFTFIAVLGMTARVVGAGVH